MAAERQGTVAVDRRRLAWHAVGGGPPLLLINGYAATGRDWDPGFTLALSRRFRVLCPDNRGIGGSELGAEPLTVAAMAANMEALLDALGLERATVAGWSMGGFVAQALAARAPARIDGLALLASDPGAPGAAALRPADWARLIAHDGTPREQARRLLGLLFPPDLAPELDRRFGDVVARARAALPEATLFAQEEAMDGWHREGIGVPAPSGPLRPLEPTYPPTRPSPPEPTASSAPPPAEPPSPAPPPAELPPSEPGAPAPFPVVIGHGALDVVIPPANAEALARRWPGASVEIFDRCAHALMAQEPVRAAALVASVGPGTGGSP